MFLCIRVGNEEEKKWEQEQDEINKEKEDKGEHVFDLTFSFLG